MQPWQTTVLCAGKYRPRQFEYHPLREDVIVFGTLKGEAVVADVKDNAVRASIAGGLARDKHDSILGLCWLKQTPNRFVVGSSHGYLRLCELDSTVLDPSPECAFARKGENTMPFRADVQNARARCSEGGRIVRKFETFDKLTSVHVNSTDQHMLASGYSSSVRLFDMATSQVVREFQGIHTDHINISRFANHSPFVFATSSFDCTVKAWDSRVRADNAPIYSCKSDQGHVMLCFSPDDVFLLTSAVDNDVTQYMAVDGRLHVKLGMPVTGLEDNFTRAYYTSSGRLILSGSSEEQTVRLHCAQTGRLIHSAEMYPGRKHGSLYVQSLRGDPHHDFQFSVLVNYRDSAYPLEVIHVDMLQGGDGEDLSSVTGFTSSSRLAEDLRRACMNKTCADCYLVSRNRACFKAHKAVLACRSAVLRRLLAECLGGPQAPGAHSQPASSSAGIPDLRRNAWAASKLAAGSDVSAASADGQLPLVCLPDTISPDVMPVILEYLYTDELNLEPQVLADSYADTYTPPSGSGVTGTGQAGDEVGMGQGRAQADRMDAGEDPKSQSGYPQQLGADGRSGEGQNGTRRQGAWLRGERYAGKAERGILAKLEMFERILEAATALELARLRSLVEWECRNRVNNETVVFVVGIGLRQGAEQLVRYCVHYLVAHVRMVQQLHGQDCLPQEVEEQVVLERRRRLFPLKCHFCGRLAPMETAHGMQQQDVQDVDIAEDQSNSAQGDDIEHDDEVEAEAEAGLAEEDNHEQLQEGGGQEEEEEEEEEEEDDSYEYEEDDHEDEHQGEDRHEDDNDSGSNRDDGGGSAYIKSTGVLRNRLVPTVTGHTGNAVLGSQMVILGGGNKRQFHSCRYILAYDAIAGAWSKLTCRGTVPTTLIYHSSTSLEAPYGDTGPRNLLVFGGSSTSGVGRDNPQLLVLDTLTMKWSCPKAEGEGPGPRTRHTTVALYGNGPPNGAQGEPSPEGGHQSRRSHPSRSHWSRASMDGALHQNRSQASGSVAAWHAMSPRDHAGPPEGVQAGPYSGTAHGAQSGGETANARPAVDSRRRSYFIKDPRDLFLRDISADTNLIMFGGYSPAAREAFNDVFVMNVSRDRPAKDPSSGCSESDRPSRRRRHTVGGAVLFSEGPANGAEFADPQGGGAAPASDGAHGSSARESAYRYLWLQPTILGTLPPPRLAHAATTCHLPSTGVGGGSGDLMVVFGGVGIGALFNDIHVLRCGDLSTMRWEDVDQAGRPPTPRYGHSMITLGQQGGAHQGVCDGSQGRMVVFGGTSGEEAYNDMYIVLLTSLDTGGSGQLVLTWSTVLLTGLVPCPRSRQSMCEMHGKLVLFGGSDEAPQRSSNRPHKSREVDTNIYLVHPDFGPDSRLQVDLSSGGGEAGGDGTPHFDHGQHGEGHAQGDDQGGNQGEQGGQDEEIVELVWACEKLPASVYEPGPEPPMLVGAVELHANMQTLVGNKLFSDLTFKFQAVDFGAPTTPTNTAHYALVPPPQPAKKVVMPAVSPPGPCDASATSSTPLPAPSAGTGPGRRGPEETEGQRAPSDAGVTSDVGCAGAVPETPEARPGASGGEGRQEPRVGPAGGGGGGEGSRDPGVEAQGGAGSSASCAAEDKAGMRTTAYSVPDSRRYKGLVLPTEAGGTGVDQLQTSAGGGGLGRTRSIHDGVPTPSPAMGWPLGGFWSPSTLVSADNGSEPTAPVGRGTPTASTLVTPLGSGAGWRREFFGGGGGGGSVGLGGGGSPLPSPGSLFFRPAGPLPAHRMVVTLRSEPMRAMLESGMRESFAQAVLVKDVREPVFRALLTYLYTDTLQLQQPEDIMELLIAANQYTLDELVSLCEGFLQGVLDTDNAASLYQYADVLNIPSLEHRVLTFMLREWPKVKESEAFMRLPVELQERIHNVRTSTTHIFQLGHKDHKVWAAGGGMADWAQEQLGDEGHSGDVATAGPGMGQGPRARVHKDSYYKGSATIRPTMDAEEDAGSSQSASGTSTSQEHQGGGARAGATQADTDSGGL